MLRCRRERSSEDWDNMRDREIQVRREGLRFKGLGTRNRRWECEGERGYALPIN